jgi:hypothetical protein
MCLETAIPLPGLPASTATPDWRLDLDTTSRDDRVVEWTGSVSHQGRTWGRFGRRGDAESWIALEGVGRLCVERGPRRAWLRPEVGRTADAGAVRRLLPYLGALAGRTVLHAASVAFRRGAVLLVGASGVGKSTLASALDADGHPLLGDDHVAIELRGDGAVVAHPSFPHVEVAEETRVAFRSDAAAASGKIPLPLRTPPSGPREVMEVCFLARGDGPVRSALEPAEVARRLLLDVLFTADPADAREGEARLDEAIAISERVPAATLTLPQGLDRLRRLLPEVVRPWLPAAGPVRR